jgi:flagellar hook-associated protein 2
MSISATSGLASGIDYSALIKQLVELQRKPIDALEKQRVELETRYTVYDELTAKLDKLKSAADAVKNDLGFQGFSTKSTNEDILTATAISTASGGKYSIVIENLAQAHKIAADGFAATTSTVAAAAGSFKFKLGATGTEQTVSVDATTTLDQLRSAINALDAGVTATIVNDGSSPNPYRLVLTSDETGASNEIFITQNDTTLNFATTLQSALDSTFKVDNMTIQRSSNSVADVIAGVTLNFNSADPLKTITLSVNRDDEAITKKVQALVDDYNEVIKYIKDNNRYNTETKTAEPLFGDSIARTAMDDVRKVMTSAISGLPSDMNRLSHVGVKTTDDGLLKLDADALKDALDGNFSGVMDLFTGDGVSDGFGKLVSDKVDQMTDFVDGRLTLKQRGITDHIKRINNDIRKKETDLADYERRLRLEFASLESLIVGLNSQSSFLSGLQQSKNQ